MYTMAALVQNGRSFLLRNCALAEADNAEWHFCAARGEQLAYLLQSNGTDASVNAGINSCGLALLSGVEDMVEAEGGVGVLLNQALAQCRDIESALELLIAGISARAGIAAGCVFLADGERIAVLDFGDGKVGHEVVRDGLLVRVDGPPSDADERAPRYERVLEFAEGLYAWLPTLDGEDVVERCRAVLRQEPLCDGSATSSTIIEVEDGRVDYALGDGRWQTKWLTENPS